MKVVHKGLVEVKMENGRVSTIRAEMSGALFKEGEVWISHCPLLELSTCGHTREEAIKNTRDAIVLFFKSCIKRGTLDQALSELKWKREITSDEEQKIEPSLVVPRNVIPAFMIDRQRGNQWSGHVEF